MQFIYKCCISAPEKGEGSAETDSLSSPRSLRSSSSSFLLLLHLLPCSCLLKDSELPGKQPWLATIFIALFFSLVFNVLLLLSNFSLFPPPPKPTGCCEEHENMALFVLLKQGEGKSLLGVGLII